MDSNVLLISEECGLISDFLYENLRGRGFNIYLLNYDSMPRSFLRRVLFEIRILAEILKDKDRYSIILCMSVSMRLLNWLLKLFITRPKKLIVVVPPSPRHIYGFKNALLIYMFRILYGILGLFGVRELLVFTTPYEKLFLMNILHNIDHVYLPVYYSRYIGVKELLLADKPTILIYVHPILSNRELLINSINTLIELGFIPKIILYVDPGRQDILCPRSPHIICLSTDTYNLILQYVTLVVIPVSTPYSNKLLVESIMNGRPVITSRNIGVAGVYEDTGLVVYEDKWLPETFTDRILKVLNQIDRFKKAMLSYKPVILNPEYGLEVIASFLSEK
jgi:glycosyltransferase involved in cell wall biosynthesis